MNAIRKNIDVVGAEINWLSEFEKTKESLVQNIHRNFIADLSTKRDSYLEKVFRIRLDQKGFYFEDFYIFLKNRVTKVHSEGISSVYEFIIDFNPNKKTGTFILGVIEKTNFGNIQNNKLSASITFEEYIKSRILSHKR